MSASFFWYDLETSGTDPRWDRIVQFAGVRTDEALNEVGERTCTYVKLADDVLPNPDAALVTGISPSLLAEQGISEWQALGLINQEFSKPDTCAVGYNSLRFDDEFVRYGLYRTLRDPYAREWQNGNSRWDILDLVRAAGALRREGIEWPVDEAGLPVYRLEVLTKANGLDHANAHDALSDVHATLGMARLIRDRHQKLFDYYLAGRFKKQPKSLLEPYGAQICVHVSGMYPRERFGFATVVSIARHPTNSNSIIVADLGMDVEMLVNGSEQEIREALFAKNSPNRPPLKEIRVNRCPFVAPMSVLTDENISRLNVNLTLIRERQRRLSKPGIAAKIQRVYNRDHPPGHSDVEAGLYGGFLKDDDRARCVSFTEELKKDQWCDLDYTDKRLHELARRLKARDFSHLVTQAEAADHRKFVSDKLHDPDAPWLNFAAFRARLGELQIEQPNAAILNELAEHVERLEKAYPEAT
ncbi:MAG: exodeoxyribonuclease I [Proteobacteria bacterium]|nr:exodeoxyribonuclease I [Pseudomonadota bacterium]